MNCSPQQQHPDRESDRDPEQHQTHMLGPDTHVINSPAATRAPAGHAQHGPAGARLSRHVGGWGDGGGSSEAIAVSALSRPRLRLHVLLGTPQVAGAGCDLPSAPPGLALYPLDESGPLVTMAYGGAGPPLLVCVLREALPCANHQPRFRSRQRFRENKRSDRITLEQLFGRFGPINRHLTSHSEFIAANARRSSISMGSASLARGACRRSSMQCARLHSAAGPIGRHHLSVASGRVSYRCGEADRSKFGIGSPPKSSHRSKVHFTR